MIWFSRAKTCQRVVTAMANWMNGNSYAISTVDTASGLLEIICSWDFYPKTNISLARRHISAVLAATVTDPLAVDDEELLYLQSKEDVRGLHYKQIAKPKWLKVLIEWKLIPPSNTDSGYENPVVSSFHFPS